MDVESSLHRELKARFACSGGTAEVSIGAYRADAVRADGAWVEIQMGPLGRLKAKLGDALPVHAMQLVKPVVLSRRIIRVDRGGRGGPHGRMSPKRGALCDVFDELVSVAGFLSHPNLQIDVLGVAIDEFRVATRRRPGYIVRDRVLRGVGESVCVAEPAHLWRLLPDGVSSRLPEPFTTLELAALIGRGEAFAQRVAYCLRLAGAVTVAGFRRRRRLYLPAPGMPSAALPPGVHSPRIGTGDITLGSESR